MEINGVRIRDITPPQDIDPSGLSVEFVRGDHFGDMYLPHGGLLAKIHNRLNNLFGQIPEVGKHHRPLSSRDVLMVLGKKLCLIAFSEDNHKHLPTWHSEPWDKFLTTSEDEVQGDKVLPVIFRAPLVDEHLKRDWGFINPVIFLVPSLFYGKPDTDEGRAVAISVHYIAEELMSREKARVGKETQQIQAEQLMPPEIRHSMQRFQSDFPVGVRTAFIMMPFGRSRAHLEIVAVIRDVLADHGIKGLRADDKQYHDDVFYNVLTYVYGCEFGIAVFERIESEKFNPNVALEVGYMLAKSKEVCLLKDRTLPTLQTDLIGKLYKVFDSLEPSKTIPAELKKWLNDKELIEEK